MPLDPRITLQAAPQPQAAEPFDPLRTMGRVYAIQGLQQEQQLNQLQLADAQRKEQERRDLGAIYRHHVTTDPTTGQSTIDLPGAMTEAYRVNPEKAFEMQEKYTKTRTESRKLDLEAQKARLDGIMKQNDFLSQLAMGGDAAIAQGADPQAVWTQMRAQAGQAGLPVSNIPETYDRSLHQQYMYRTLELKDKLTAASQAIDQQLREREVVVQEGKERREGAKPTYEVGQGLRDALVACYGERPRGQRYTQQEIAQARQDVQEAELQKRRETGSSQLVQTPEGYMRVNPRTGAVEPAQGPSGTTLQPKPTTEQSRAASYGERAAQADQIVRELEDLHVRPNPATKALERLPFGNALVPESQQRMRQAISQFAQSLLRKESGAAISKSEYDQVEKTYFPQAGDSEAVVQQKRQAREAVIAQLRQESGPALPPTGTGRKRVSRQMVQDLATERHESPAAVEKRLQDLGYDIEP